MLIIVSFPTIVQEALTAFGDVFDTKAAHCHSAAYLTGLMVAERKTISAVNRVFALTAAQSCLNRWLPEVQWNVKTGITRLRKLRGAVEVEDTAKIQTFWCIYCEV